MRNAGGLGPILMLRTPRWSKVRSTATAWAAGGEDTREGPSGRSLTVRVHALPANEQQDRDSTASLPAPRAACRAPRAGVTGTGRAPG